VVKVLFVCLGNICRSPAAQGIFESLVEKNNLKDKIYIDSCGTSDHHAGQRPDPRMREHALKRGHQLTHLARGFEFPKDFIHFDYILTMDRSNYQDLRSFSNSEKYHSKISPITNFCKKHSHSFVPDPYYGGSSGFETVLDLLEDACENLLMEIREKHQLG